ncbi:MAG TPA: 3-deoxy-7-phosphoheptulonate synthase [Longimicrobiales bacterium]|nr:3-deoxy-7-phosphoheptulonate synthase [Longimicrobiales bacterium]
MLITLPSASTEAECDALRERLDAMGLQTRALCAPGRQTLLCYGDPQAVKRASLLPFAPGTTVTPIPQPYVLCTRQAAPGRAVIIPGPTPVVVGGREIVLAAGPCSVEGLPMLRATAAAVGQAGAAMLRGGAFKPRTSPYAFSGLGEEALEMLGEVRRETGLAVVTEVMDARQIEAMIPHVDVFQVGARNMQNFSLLAELGRIRRPVLLKRGASATVEELLLSAEHIVSRGNDAVILCERGVRAHETLTRNTLDIGAVAALKKETHLPVFVDPSHAAGRADLVPALALAAVAAGCDGLIIEVHPSPADALSDGDQSLTPEAFAALVDQLAPVAAAVGRSLATQVAQPVARVA